MQQHTIRPVSTHEPTGGYCAARKSEEERADFGSADHGDWMGRASRILTGERRAERVELRIGGWLQGEPRSGEWVVRGSPFTWGLDPGKLSAC
jgi:hypothetical protein